MTQVATDDARHKGTAYDDAEITRIAAFNPAFRDQFRQLDSPFRLYDTDCGTIFAHRAMSSGRWIAVGSLTWFTGPVRHTDDGRRDDRSNINGGVISTLYVTSTYRRRGLATAMLTFARDRHPQLQIRHSGALSGDGRAFATAAP